MPTINRLVDPSAVLPYFYKRGFQTDILSKCNSVQFKYIDGVGTGYLLMEETVYNNNLVNGTLPLSMLVNGNNRNLQVLDLYRFDHPSTTTKRLVIAHVAEEKQYFTKLFPARNYNVMVRRSYISNSIDMVAPDSPPKTMKQIMEDITGFSGSSFVYNGPNVQPLDVFIEGMSVLEAMDILCSSLGLVWTFTGSTVYVFNAFDTIDYSKVSDVRYNNLTNPIKDISVTFPVLDCCLEKPTQFYTDNDNTSSVPGSTVNTYYPYLPAIIDRPSGTVDNATNLGLVATYLKNAFKIIESNSETCITYEFFKTILPSSTPNCFKVLFSDYGAGPRTILDSRDYPYLKTPDITLTDNQARNWIGTLYEGYKGQVLGFWVTPQYGIDGKLPKVHGGDPGIWVTNLYRWDYGDEGAWIRVEWDCVNYRWIPLQQEYRCPPSSPPPPQTPPPEEVTPDDEFQSPGDW
jgi:hypothetical protein